MNKKQYIQPQAQVVVFKAEQHLMVNSPLGTNVYSDPALDEEYDL